MLTIDNKQFTVAPDILSEFNMKSVDDLQSEIDQIIVLAKLMGYKVAYDIEPPTFNNLKSFFINIESIRDEFYSFYIAFDLRENHITEIYLMAYDTGWEKFGNREEFKDDTPFEMAKFLIK